jgi:hypothetical protein
MPPQSSRWKKRQPEYERPNTEDCTLPRSIAEIGPAVTPIHFTFGWGYTLLTGARVQKEYRDDEGKKPKALFPIHRRRQYCPYDRLDKIFQCAH